MTQENSGVLTAYGRQLLATRSVWAGMGERCRRKSNRAYPHYGGRGIKICERWRRFENFLEDMGLRPWGLTLERIDVNGDYEPGNCKWATMKEQCNNTRRTCRIEFKGELRPINNVAEELGIKPDTLWRRLRRGWPLERAISTPTIYWGKNAGL